jgi:hypothetical protein
MNAAHRIRTAVFAVLLTGAVQPALADRGIPWNSLDRDEQSVLDRHRGEWSRLDAQEQRRLLGGARKYLNLPPEKRRAVENQRDQYRKLSPREREELRDRYSRQKQKHR